MPPARESSIQKLLRYFPWFTLVVVLIHIVYLTFLHFNPDIRSTNAGRVINDTFILFGELVIIYGCIFATRRIAILRRRNQNQAQDGVIRRANLAILFIGLSAISNTIGQLIWIWYDGTLDAVPFPGVNDGFFLANYPFLFLGIALLIPRGGSGAGRARLLVDAGTLVLSVLAIFWYFRLGPTLATLSGTPLVKTISLAYPLSDLVGSVAAILLYFNPFGSAAPQRTLMRLTLGLTCSALANMVYSYLLASGTYYSGHFIDAGFPLTWLLIAWAVFSYPADVEQLVQARPELLEASGRLQMRSRVTSVFRAILPLLFTLGTSVLLLLGVAFSKSAPLEQIVVVCAGLFLLPVARQSLTLTDNMMLNERLRVALDQSQQAFQQSQDELVSTALRAEQLDDLLANIKNIQEVHARLAHGDFNARALVQGPLSPVAQSLNLLIERMQRWLQIIQVNQALTREAELLSRLLEKLNEGQSIPNQQTNYSLLPTGNALLIANRLQSRLSSHFHRQRETLQIAGKRIETTKEIIQQIRSDMNDQRVDQARIEQALTLIERGLLHHESLLQQLYQQSSFYMPSQPQHDAVRSPISRPGRP